MIPLVVLLIFIPGVLIDEQSNWERATPTSAGFSRERIERLKRDAANGVFPNLHAILVARHGKLVVEEYFNGFDVEDRQFTASVSKSVASIAFGIAIDHGLIRGVGTHDTNVLLAELIPPYAELLADAPKRNLRLRHVLTMTAGLAWDERTYSYDDPRNDWYRARESEDPVRFTLAKPVAAEPGTVFNYNGGLSIILSYLVESGSGLTADAFAHKYLFEPLGIADYAWERIPCGLTDTDGGLYMRPRDMAKLGQLYLDGGRWRGSRIVSEEWVDESVREHMVNEQSPNYGFQWWCGNFHYANRSVSMFLASGHGGQVICVIPEFDLVVVLTHEVFDNPMGQIHNNAILGRYILPAVDGHRDVAETAELEASDLAHYLGDYESEHGRFTVVERDGKLRAEPAGQPPMEIVPLSRTRFRGTTLGLIDVDLRFDFAENGEVQGVHSTYAFTESYYRKVRSD